MADAPNSYKDQYWTDLSSNAEAEVGIPAGLLTSIVQRGERSNANQISEAGAKTVFQIIPSTHKAILDKYGIDTYLSPKNTAKGAALLLKESLARNKGDASAAIGEYHGGTDRKNWGPKTYAYIQRVLGGAEDIRSNAISSDFDKWATSQGFGTNSNDQRAQVKQIGADFDKSMAAKPTESITGAQGSAPDISAISADFDQWKANQPEPAEPRPELGLLGGIKEAFTGAQRATPESQSLPEWTGMPELNQLSMASAKTGLGTIFAAPDEVVQVIKANYPDTRIRQDKKGNYIISSSIDGADYVIPPGLTMGDLPRALGGLAAFTPAGRAISTLGMTGVKGLAAVAGTSGLGAAATQAVVEGTQAATGGDFSGKDIALTGLVGAVAPPLIGGIAAGGKALAAPVKKALSTLIGPRDAQMAEAAASKVGKPFGEQEPIVMGANPEYTQASKPVVAPVAAEPMAAPELSAVTRNAAQGSPQAIRGLAEQVAPDAKMLKAAENLKISDYLQPDHISTNQSFKELAQTIKSIPTSPAATAEREGLLKVAKRADDLITELGGTDDLAGVSQKIKAGLSETNIRLKSEASKIYTEIDDKLVKQAIPAPAPNILAFIKTRANSLGGEANLTAGEQSILKKLSPAGDKQPTYALLDQTRKEIGAAKRSAQNAFGTSDSKLLGDLESALRIDQGAVAKANGFGDKWEMANGLTRTYKGVQDDLTSLFGKSIDGSIVTKFSSSVNALPKGDTSKFIKLIKSVPEDMRHELVASGLNTVFSKNKGGLNFKSYADWYEGLLKNKPAHTAIMTNLPPEARKSLSDLYRVSKGISNSTGMKIPNGRLAEGTKRLEHAEGLAGKLYEAARYDIPANLAAGAAGMAAGAVGGPVAGIGIGAFVRNALSRGAKTPGMEAADKLLMSPEFMEAVNIAAKGKPEVAAKNLAKSKVFSNFVFKLNNPKELSNRERWILQALEDNSDHRQQSNSR